MKRTILVAFCIFLLQTTFAQSVRPFYKWSSNPFVSYQLYHPNSYILIDNNWNILMSFRQVHSSHYLDSIGVKYTKSQLMLLHLGGLLEDAGKDKWKTTIPIFDSLQTVDIRRHCKDVALGAYKKIENDCKAFSKLLARQNMKNNTFTLMFSYILDHQCWEALNIDRSNMMKGATWKGLYWILYNKRDFYCGTNSYYSDVSISQNWSPADPSFINNVYDSGILASIRMEYVKSGKIIDSKVLTESIKYGLADKDGILTIPIIDERQINEFNRLSKIICDKMANYMNKTPYIEEFMRTYGIENRKMTIVILYHEVMWDILDQLIEHHVIEKPALWTSKKPTEKMLKDVIFINK